MEFVDRTEEMARLDRLAASGEGGLAVLYGRRDWRGLLGRLAREARAAGWRGPLIFDELPLDRLVGMGLVRREVPFGESEKKSRKALYKIDDPFCRLWFRVVAPHRGPLAAGTRETRLQLLDRFWPELAARAWEELCRARLPRPSPSAPLPEKSSGREVVRGLFVPELAEGIAPPDAGNVTVVTAASL